MKPTNMKDDEQQGVKGAGVSIELLGGGGRERE
jgi:hypothetical protein